jgi:enoyl-CoA hydratase/carnithine racemase
MNAQGHAEFVDAFYRIGRERANKIVVLTGAGGGFFIDVDRSSFGNVSDPEVWSQVHDEGVQALENIANIRVPVIAAIEGRAHLHSDYVLLANIIVAGEGATFQDVAHYAVGVAPGDGIFITWSYRGGAGRARHFCSIRSLCRRALRSNGEWSRRLGRTGRRSSHSGSIGAKKSLELYKRTQS